MWVLVTGAMIVPPAPDQRPGGHGWCGVGHRGDVPYVEALAFWGHRVDVGAVPRSYALGVLAEHALLRDPTMWDGAAPTRSHRVCAAADDLAHWLDVVVGMAYDPTTTFWDFLAAEAALAADLARAFLADPTRAEDRDGD